MRCADARGRFTRHLDDRLAPAERSELAEHLAGCAACAAELARWEAAAASLRARGPTPAPAGLADRAFRAAMQQADAAPPLAASFIAAARRAVLAGAVAAAAVWLGLAATGAAPGGAPAAHVAAEDPMELALHVQLWAPEGGDDAP